MEYLEDILVRKAFKKLFACLLILQPLSSKELKYFFPFLYWFAKYKKFLDIDRVIAKTEKKFNIPIERLAIFTDKDLYSSNGIIKKAVTSNLILEVPFKKGGKQNNYYFVNSDLIFKITEGSKLEIIEAGGSINPVYEIGDKIVSNGPVYLMESSLLLVLNLFSWIIKHGDKLKTMWNKKFSRNPFRGNLYKKSIKDGVIYKDFDGYKLLSFLNAKNSLIRFSPSYKLLDCFPETDIDYRITPIQNLRKLMVENYKIYPDKRAKKFISLLIGDTDYGVYVATLNIRLSLHIERLIDILYGDLPSILKKDEEKYFLLTNMGDEIHKNLSIWRKAC